MGSFLLVGGSSDIGIILTKKLVEGGNKVTLLVRDESRAVSYTHLTLPTSDLV